MPLSRDQILATKGRLKRETVHVPEWATDGEDTVIVQELTGEARDEFEASLRMERPVGIPEPGKTPKTVTVPDLANTRAKLVARAVVDADGNALFTPADVFALGQLSAAALQRVFDAASRLSGMGDTSVEDAKGNSDAAQSGDSTSD